MGILSAVPGSQKVGMPHKQGQVPESLPSPSPFFVSVFNISEHYMYHLRSWNRLVIGQCLTNFFPEQWSSTSYMITSVWKLAFPIQATQFTPILSPFHPWHFMGLPPPPSFSRFCDTHISSNRVVVQTSSLLTLIHPSATDLWKRIPERIASSVNNSPSLVLLKTDLQRKINQKIWAHPEALKARAFLIPTRGLTWYMTWYVICHNLSTFRLEVRLIKQPSMC